MIEIELEIEYKILCCTEPHFFKYNPLCQLGAHLIFHTATIMGTRKSTELDGAGP